MRDPKNVFIIAIIFIWLIASYLNSDRFMTDQDVIWRINQSRALLRSGFSLESIFLLFPHIPMIFSPIVWISDIFKIDPITPVKIYILLISNCIIAYSWYLARPLSKNNQHSYTKFFITTAAIINLYPLHEIGQKSHLFLIFIIPYLTLIILRLSNQKIPIRQIYVITIIALLGVTIKPQYLGLPLLLEMLVIVKNKKISLRPEHISLAILYVAYYLILVIFDPTFFPLVEHVKKIYIPQATSLSLSEWVIRLQLPIVAILTFFTSRLADRRPNKLAQVLIMVIIFGVLNALIQKRGFWHHLLIPNTAALLLMSVSLYRLKFQNALTSKHTIISGGLSFALIVFSCIYFASTYVSHEINPYYRLMKGTYLSSEFQPFIQAIEGKKVHHLDVNFTNSFFLIHLSGATYTSRYSVLNKIPMLIEDPTSDLAQMEIQMITYIIEDITIQKPDYIIFEESLDSSTFLQGYSTYDFLILKPEFQQIMKEFKLSDIPLRDHVVYERRIPTQR